MTQEQKDLLLKDLSARLPYGVMVDYESHIYILNEIDQACKDIDYITVRIQDVERLMCIKSTMIENIKPYLFPLSSMTLEQRCKLRNLLPNNCDVSFKNLKITFYDEGNIQLEQLEKVFNFLNLYHFDYRGLIEKGLAIDATGLNIY